MYVPAPVGLARTGALDRARPGLLKAATLCSLPAPTPPRWFRGNVEGDMVHPVDGKTYPRCERRVRIAACVIHGRMPL